MTLTTPPETATAPFRPFGVSGDDADRKTLKQIIQELEPDIRAAEEHLDTERRMPLDLVHKMYDRGMFRALLPKVLGGLEAHPHEYLDAVEECSRINGSVGWLCMLHAGGSFAEEHVVRPIIEKERWILAGNLGRAAGKAKKVPGGYMVSGRWPFCSGSPEATYLFGSCILYDENGEMQVSPIDGNPWYITLYFRAKDVTLHDTWDGLGLRGTGSGDIEVNDLFVPREMANEKGVYNRPYDGPLHQARFSLLSHGAHALGLAKAAIEEFTKIVHRSAKHGSLRQARLGREQFDQFAVGKAHAMIQAARLFLWDTAGKVYEDAKTNVPPSYEMRVLFHEANTYAVHTAKEAVRLIFERAGSPAVFRNAPLERIHRDITTAANHLLVQESSLDRIGQYLLTKDMPGGPEIDTTGTGHIAGPHPQFAGKKLPKV